MTVELETPAASPSSPSGPTGFSGTEPPGTWQCPYCDFVGGSEHSLRSHTGIKHKGHRQPAYQDKPRREAPKPAAEPIAPPGPPAPPPVDLVAVGKDLAGNIRTVGQLLHGALYMLKLRHVTTGKPPAIDTHLAYAVQLRADMTAEVLMGYAAQNPTVMRAVNAFNGLFVGGALGAVIGTHVVAAAASVGIETPISEPAESMFIPDVLQHVAREDAEIEARLRHMAAAAHSNGAA
ncbi:MAG TPA: hypothetical protein VJ741_09690 [Solirubrobacteraceae bacterium]|nr:hypothetical protein [Solirubrobacteraceae bacterium]